MDDITLQIVPSGQIRDIPLNTWRNDNDVLTSKHVIIA